MPNQVPILDAEAFALPRAANANWRLPLEPMRVPPMPRRRAGEGLVAFLAGSSLEVVVLGLILLEVLLFATLAGG
jgi:hypothetical protein